MSYARDGFRAHRLSFTGHAGARHPGATGIHAWRDRHRRLARGTAIDVAVDYALWVAGAGCQRGLYARSGGQPGNAVAWDDPTVNADCHGFYRATRATLEGAWLRPRHDGYIRFQARGGEIMHVYLSGAIGDDDALAALEQAYRAEQ